MRGALEPERVGRLCRVVEEDLGLPLHRAVEGAKVRLSQARRGSHRATRDHARSAGRAQRRSITWIDEDLAAIDGVLDDVLARAGVDAKAVDRVFATGGSSLVPAVRGAARSAIR